ncbi:MAG: hypothetical protein PHY13_05005 [Clostridia bacterium]|nr:hypothetical protein [Clostridia bacterium]
MKSELLHWEKPKLVGIELQELAIEIAARATSCGCGTGCWSVYSMPGCTGY